MGLIIEPHRAPLIRNAFGFGFSPGGRAAKKRAAAAASNPVFDPLTLSPSLWVRASFAASPWADESGNSRDLSEATNPPGTFAIGAFTAADFDGTNDRLSRANTISTVCPSAGPFGIAGLIWIDTAAADAGAAAFYLNPSIICDDTEGRLGVSASDAGISFGCFNGATFNSVQVACGTGAWHAFFASSDGTDFILSVDAGSTSTLARGAISYAAADTLMIGKNYDGSALLDGKTAELLFKPSVFDATNRSNMRSYWNARYGLSL